VKEYEFCVCVGFHFSLKREFETDQAQKSFKL
jgi:hypothetical protein